MCNWRWSIGWQCGNGSGFHMCFRAWHRDCAGMGSTSGCLRRRCGTWCRSVRRWSLLQMVVSAKSVFVRQFPPSNPRWELRAKAGQQVGVGTGGLQKRMQVICGKLVMLVRLVRPPALRRSSLNIILVRVEDNGPGLRLFCNPGAVAGYWREILDCWVLVMRVAGILHLTKGMHQCTPNFYMAVQAANMIARCCEQERSSCSTRQTFSQARDLVMRREPSR